jgi:hypothetical protein
MSIRKHLTLVTNFLQNLNYQPVKHMSPVITWRCECPLAGFASLRLIRHPSSLPVNPIRDVKRVLSRFKLPAEQEVYRVLRSRFWLR